MRLKKRKKSKMGRPPLAPQDRRDHRVNVRLTGPQFAELSRLAAEAGVSVSRYLAQFIGGGNG
jgi:hypothetical protein